MPLEQIGGEAASAARMPGAATVRPRERIVLRNEMFGAVSIVPYAHSAWLVNPDESRAQLLGHVLEEQDRNASVSCAIVVRGLRS